jgi:hypothetical protein
MDVPVQVVSSWIRREILWPVCISHCDRMKGRL